MDKKSKPVQPSPKPRLRARPRARRRINWGPVLLVALGVNVFLACFNSKITAIRSLNLDGVRQSERQRLARITEAIKGQPALKVDPRFVENFFMNESRVKSADFRRNIFGVARLMLEYREPVAAIVGSKSTYLDSTGVVFTDPEEKGTFPQIRLEPKIRVSVVALSGVINYKSVARLADLVHQQLADIEDKENPIEIEVQETGGLCLNMNNGTVDLGTSEQLPEKIEKLKQILQTKPDLFEVNSSLNLMVPENPQVVSRKKENG